MSGFLEKAKAFYDYDRESRIAGFIIATFWALAVIAVYFCAKSDPTFTAIEVAHTTIMFGVISGIFTFGFVLGVVREGSIGIGVLSGTLTAISIVAIFANGIQFNWLVVAVVLLIITEIKFWTDSEKKPSHESIMRWTVYIKLKSLGFALLTGVNIFGIYSLVQNHRETVLKWIGYLGAGIIIVAITIGAIYGYFWLNSFKYRKEQKRKRRRY